MALGFFNSNSTPEQVMARKRELDYLASRMGGATNVGQGIGDMISGLAVGLGRRSANQAETAGRAGGDGVFNDFLNLYGSKQPQNAPQMSAGSVLGQQAPMTPQTSQIESGPVTGAMVDGFGKKPLAQASVAPNPNWLTYDNKNAIRSQPLNPNLEKSLSFLPEMGVSMRVFSGGQDSSGPKRTGSHRHDDGNAGDVFFYKDGKQLDWRNKADIPVLQGIVSRAKANGVTGFGAGEGYMQPGSMHVGLGSPAVWGAGGKGSNAPEWLRQAYNGQAQQPPVQVASNDPQFTPANAPAQDVAQAPAPQPQQQAQQTGPSDQFQQAMKVYSNAWSTPEQKQLAMQVISQEMQRQDPAYQSKMQGEALDQKYKQAQIDNMGDGDVVSVGGRLVNRKTGQVVYDPPQDVNDQNEYGLNPIYGKDPQGNLVIMQPSKQGGVKQVDLPKGVTLAPGIDYLNTGTGFVPVDKRGGVVPQSGNVAPVPIDVTGKARADEVGAAQGKAEVAAPGDIAAADNALDLLTQIESNPYLDRGTGFSSYGNSVPGTGGYDFQNVVDQAKSGAFLTAIQQMRGLGSLSNAEGDAATRAVTRINTATSKEAFLSAVNDYKSIITQGKARAQKRLGINSEQPAVSPAPQSNSSNLKQKYGLE